MEGPFGFFEIEAMLFGSIDDCWKGDLLVIFPPQKVFDIAVIVRF